MGRSWSNPSSGGVAVLADPAAEAAQAGLVYTSDAEPGLRRVGRGRGFVYRDPDGKRTRDPAVLDRIRSLAIPPAWKDVWITSHPRGHLQATGRDARGRKQHRYHPRWREMRDADKFDRMAGFGKLRRRSFACSTPRTSASATRNTRGKTDRTGSPRCATGTST